jgi:antirestriction protein ArdC
VAHSKVSVKEITDKLEQCVKDVFTSDKFSEYLKTMSRFYRYSTRNTMLIYMQKPNATYVAGFQKWKNEFQRNIIKGERGIQIIAPVPFTIKEEKQKINPDTKMPVIGDDGLPETEEVERRLARYRVTHVFDISQTEGKPLPSLVENLIGDVERYDLFMDVLREVSPLPIVLAPLDPGIDGTCRYGKEIAIREGMSETQTVCAAIHEIAHAKLHDMEALRLLDDKAKPKDRRTKEVEAESVSYAVCQYYGIETGANSFGYIAEWSKGRDLKELNASLDTIRKTAADLIESIDGSYRALAKKRGIDLTVTVEPVVRTAVEASVSIPQTSAVNPNSVIRKNYEKFAEMFPNVANGEYRYLRLESTGFDPLSVELVGRDRVSVMQTYTQNGDLMYSPMMSYQIDRAAKTLTAVEYQNSNPPLYQRIDEDGIGHSVDGNGKERIFRNLQNTLNDVTAQWFTNTAEQGYIPVRANMVIDGEETRITFDADGNPIMPEPKTPPKEYRLGYGFFGNGITIWNKAEDRNGDYATVAHIERDRTVSFYDKDLPEDVKAAIENTARTMDDDALDPLPQANVPRVTELDMSLPDPLTSAADRDAYGYTYEDMLPLSNGRAVELYDADHAIYLLYPDNSEGMAFDRDEIINHDGLCGIERADWERSPILAAQLKVAANSEAARESDFLYSTAYDGMFGIYQLKQDEGLRNHRFESMESITSHGLSVERGNYELIYAAPLTIRDTQTNLNKIYQDFQGENPERPADYAGRSISVSDVIVLQWRGNVSSHYVDSFGFSALPSFTGNETQSETYSPLGNNFAPTAQTAQEYTGPTVAELKSEVDAGRAISILDLAKAAAAERGQGAAQPARTKEKGSLLDRLEANKVRAAMESPGGGAAHHTTHREEANRQ